VISANQELSRKMLIKMALKMEILRVKIIKLMMIIIPSMIIPMKSKT